MNDWRGEAYSQTAIKHMGDGVSIWNFVPERFRDLLLLVCQVNTVNKEKLWLAVELVRPKHVVEVEAPVGDARDSFEASSCY